MHFITILLQRMKIFNFFIIILLFTAYLSACSESSEETAKPGSINAQAEQIGHEAAQAIQAPMDRAQIVVDQENKRLREMEDRLNK